MIIQMASSWKVFRLIVDQGMELTEESILMDAGSTLGWSPCCSENVECLDIASMAELVLPGM